MTVFYNGGIPLGANGAYSLTPRPASGVPARAPRVGGWAVDDEMGAAYFVDAGNVPVPNTATFHNGMAFTSDGALYITTDTNYGTFHWVGTKRVRSDGALLVASNATAFSWNGGVASTSTGASMLGGDGVTFTADLQRSIAAITVGSGTPTFTRATVAYVTDFEGLLKPVLSGEARFTGARRVYNLVATKSEDFSNAAWTKTSTTAAATTLTATGANATTIAASAITSASQRHVLRVQLSRITGTGNIQLTLDNGSTWTTVTLTGTDQVFSISQTLANPQPGIRIVTSGDAINATKIQVEGTVGQSNTNPSEYVSVGVLSAPYHGANVDGVKYFTTLNGNTVSSNVVTEATGAKITSATAKFASASRVSGDYFSTPDAAANRITGDIDIDVDLVDNDPVSTTSIYAAKGSSAGAGQSWLLQHIGGAQLRLHYSVDGTNYLTADSTSSPTITAGVRTQVRVKRISSTGVITFYQSTNGGTTWTQLGNTVAGTSGALSAGTKAVEAGSYSSGALNLPGRIYRMRVYSGDRDAGGTLAVDFNPNTFASGTTWTSASTGEIWTINGNAKVFGGSGTSSIAAPWDAYGPYGYLAEGARTNLCLQSQTLDNASWVKDANVGVTADAAVAPDGTSTADKIIEQATAAQHRITQSITTTAVAHTWSVYVKAAERSQVWLFSTNANVGRFFTLTGSGTVGSVVVGAPTTSTIDALSNGWYKVSITFTAIAAADTMMIGTSTADGTLSYAGTLNSGIYAWGAQLEAASFASSYIATTTASVTRNVDTLNYAASGNIGTVANTLYAEPKQYASGGADVVIAFSNGNTYGSGNGLLLRYNAANTGVIGGNASATGAVALTANGLNKFGGKVNTVGTTQQAFANGTSTAVDATLDWTGVNSNNINIGNLVTTSESQPFWGTIRNVRIYNRALTDAQMVAMTT